MQSEEPKNQESPTAEDGPTESPSTRRTKRKVKSVTAAVVRPDGWSDVTALQYIPFEESSTPLESRQFPNVKSAVLAMKRLDKYEAESSSGGPSPTIQYPPTFPPPSPMCGDRSNSGMGAGAATQTGGSPVPSNSMSNDRSELLLIRQQQQATEELANKKKRKIKSVTSSIVNRGSGFSAPPLLPAPVQTSPASDVILAGADSTTSFETTPLPTRRSQQRSPMDQTTPSKRSGDKPSCILDFIWLGGVDGAKDEVFLKKHNITTIINISTEDYTLPGATVIHEEVGMANATPSSVISPTRAGISQLPTGTEVLPHTSKITVHKFQAHDSADFPIQQYFPRCFEILDAARTSFYDSLLTLDKRSDSSLRYLQHNDRQHSIDHRAPRVGAPVPLNWGDTGVGDAHSNTAASPMIRHNSGVGGDDEELERTSKESDELVGTKRSGRVKQSTVSGESARVLYANVRRVLVHCQKGRSRSATVVAAYIMKCNGWTATETLQYVAGLRPVIEPNLGFLFRLRDMGRTMTFEDRTKKLRDLTLLVRGVHPSWLVGGGRRLRSRLSDEVGRVWKLEVRPYSSPSLVAVSFCSAGSVKRALNLYKYHPRRFYSLYHPYKSTKIDDADKPVSLDGGDAIVELFRKLPGLPSAVSGSSTPPVAPLGGAD